MSRTVRTLLVAALYAAVVAFPSSAQELLTLEEAIRSALDNNYGVRLARQEAEIAENNATAGNAGFLPTIDATGSYGGSNTATRQEYNTGAVIDRSGASATTLSSRVGLDWTLFDGFLMFTTYDQLQRLEQVGELNLRREMEQTVLDVTASYFDMVSRQYLIRVYRNALELSRERIRLAEARSTVGTGAAPDLLKAQVDLLADSSALMRQELALQTTKASFNALLGRPAATEFAVAEIVPPVRDLELADLTTSALARNTVLRAAELNRELAQLELDAVQSLHYPTLSLNLGYGFSESTSEAGLVLSNRSYGPTYGVSLGWRLFDGFNVQRQAENARIRIDMSTLEFEQQRTQLEADILTAYRAYTTNREILQLEIDNLAAAQRNADIAAERLRVGTITSYELREIQRDLLEAENRIIQARYQAKLAETTLLLISGRLLQ